MVRLCAAFAVFLAGASSGEAAIRASGGVEPFPFVPLSELADPFTTFSLHIQSSASDRFGGISDEPAVRSLIEAWSSRTDPKTRAILEFSFQPEVLESALVRWPPRPGALDDRSVWLIGWTLSEGAKTLDWIESIRTALKVSVEDVFGRTRNGRRYLTFIHPDGAVHLIPGDRQVFLSPNLFIIQAMLDHESDSPPSPVPVEGPADIHVGWRLPSPPLPHSETAHTVWGSLIQSIREGRFEVSLRALEIGLEAEIRWTGPGVSAATSAVRSVNPLVLGAIPPDADLVLVSGGISGATAEDEAVEASWFERPFALGIGMEDKAGPPPSGWRIDGGFESADFLGDASEESFLEEVETFVGDATGEWTSEFQEGLVRFSNRGGPFPDWTPSDEFLARATRFMEGALVGGVVAPRLLAAPLQWQAILAGEHNESLSLNPASQGGFSPIEFNIGRDADGVRVRMVTERPQTYLLLLASLLFVADIEYGGDWATLSESWEQSIQEHEGGGEGTPASQATDAVDRSWPSRLRGISSTP